jgi:hypothetical protein
MKKADIENIFERLNDEGLIKYGSEIRKEALGICFGTDEYDHGDYIYPLLELKGYIEQDRGMFCETRQGNLYIGHADEAPEYSRKRRRRADNLDKRTRKILETMNYRNMSPSARAEAMLEKRLLEMKLRHSRLIIREIEYYVDDEEVESDE